MIRGLIGPKAIVMTGGAIALALGLPGRALAQHGRPPMVYVVDSISAKGPLVLPGEAESEGLDINNLGEVVGWSAQSSGPKHAFKRSLLGSTIDLGAAYPLDTTVANGINDNSEVVGYRRVGIALQRAFYWSSSEGFVIMSHVNPPGVIAARDYVAKAINNQGRIVGWALADQVGYENDAITWWHHDADPAIVYTAPAGFSNWVNDISDSSWFAGVEYDVATNHYAGYRFRAGTLEYPPDPTPELRLDEVFAVNEAGTVVGSTYYPSVGASRAVRWRRSGNPLILGVLPGGAGTQAFDINESEFVVGYDYRGGNAVQVERAFLFHYDFGMIELPPPAWEGSPVVAKCRAKAVNDRKENGLVQATGYCTRNGMKRAVRWDIFVSEHPAP
jgi:probable HAF family extracellular repeat protein